VIFLPPPFAAETLMEAADAEIDLINAHGGSALDMVKAWEFLQDRSRG
jgi:succinyl-CoA synthetase alpha subunit